MTAHRSRTLVVFLTLFAGACSPSDGEKEVAKAGENHLACAALISAADRLVASGQVSAGDVPMDNALTASMTHLNAWAIAEGIKEAEAFDALNKERDRLLAELAPEEISSRARRCLDSAA